MGIACFKTSKCNFTLLPPQIIAKILINLDFKERLNAARVCKSWYYASCDPSINQNICVQIQNNFEWIDNFSRPFNGLVLFETNFDKFNYESFLNKFGQNIEFIEFNSCKIILQQLLDCLILMSNLSTITIESNKTFVQEINKIECDETILAKNLNRIKHLYVCLDASDAGGLEFLMNMMPNLKSINFIPHFWCGDYIYDTFFNYINTFDDVNLDELELGSGIHVLCDNFFDEFFRSKSNLNILSLTLNGRHYLRVFYYKQFCEKLSSLQKLSMHCPRIYHEHMLNMICRYMTKLTELELTNLPCLKIQNLGAIQHLQKLTLEYHKLNVEEEETHLSELFLKLNPSNLTDLCIRGVVTKNILLSICQNCTNLTSLQLSHVAVNNFSPIFQYLQKLKRLHLIFEIIPDINDNKIDYDIINLQLLDDLLISEFVPGMTLELMKQLPILKQVTIHPIERWCATFPCKVINIH